MSEVANEFWSVFDARRVKAPELKGLDAMVNGFVGIAKNRRPVLKALQAQVERIERLEPEIAGLSSTRFDEEVGQCRDLARRNRLKGDALDRAMAVIREGAKRALGLRPYKVQLMGALAMCQGAVAEMATGEGKTLTASLAATLWGWGGRAVHVITVNDYLVARDAEEMGPVYRQLGLRCGHVTHETTPQERIDHYRRDVVYVTSKELVADFLRDQIMLGTLRSSTQTQVGMLINGSANNRLQVPGLFRVIVDEADSLLIDEAVTPLIISNSPDDNPNADLYRAADGLARQLEVNKDFTLDKEVKQIDLTFRGQDKLEELSGEQGFWKGKRRREELVTQALSALHCFNRDEQYLVTPDEKVQIIDEFTGRVMADRSWRHGLHQAIEVKEGVPVTADKENLARQSFQRFFRQYPIMGGMTGTAWESRGELWQIYQRPIVRIPTNKPNIRVQLPHRMFADAKQKYDAVVKRVLELNDRGVPVLVGTKTVWASEEVSKRLAAAGRAHRVLNAAQNEQEATIVAEAGQPGRITVATNMAGRGTDIKLGKGVAEKGGLHVISCEPNNSFRVDRQLYGRAARQGDPGTAQLFCSVDDELFVRHAPKARRAWRAIGPNRLIRLAQARAERLARFNRKQVLKADEWTDQSLPF
ncbi:MAG: preprotein translocase subunit SecA [Phycisphaerales bacterium]|nr:preprotein translocase subunit SecA [Phycisphaerales bacterium]